VARRKARKKYSRSLPNVKALSRSRITLTPLQTTKITGFGLNATYDLLRSGEMPSIKVGNKFYVPRPTLMQWLKDAASRGGANAAA
jgi:excisionase family DNA binding protein